MFLQHTIVLVFLEKLHGANVMTCFIPAGCTGLLQPLDISVNDSFKKSLRDHFQIGMLIRYILTLSIIKIQLVFMSTLRPPLLSQFMQDG